MDTGISTSSALAVQQWQDKAFQEYLGLLPLTKYMGTDENALIQVNEDLKKSKGDKIVFNLIAGLSGSGVQGDSTLEGNEEQLNAYAQAVTIDLHRNAVRLTGKMSNQRYPFEMRDKAKPALSQWLAHFAQDRAFQKLGSIDGVLYGSATEAQKDTWLANNSDRVLFGAATSNNSSNDHSASLLNVDATTDKLTCAQISLAKRMAKLASPKIRPIAVPDGAGTEVYILFAHPYAVRDLKTDSTWTAAQRDALPRSMENPLFTGALGYWDGVLVVETDKIPVYADVGNGSTVDVAQNFLCGAQALLWPLGGGDSMGRLGFIEKPFDYDNQTGVAIEAMFEVAKARFATGAAGVTKDHGVVTVYTSAQPD